MGNNPSVDLNNLFDSVRIVVLSIVCFAFGIIVIWKIFQVALLLYKNKYKKDDKEECLCYSEIRNASWQDICSVVMEKRNEFWLYYGQIIIALVIAIILAVLLLTKVIDASAGLPLLSAMGGFTIAKSTDSRDRRNKDGRLQ
jgi:Fe2+ transport system protein B